MRHLVNSEFFEAAQRIGAALLIGLILVISALSVRPDWHSDFHTLVQDTFVQTHCDSEPDHDSDPHSGHECVIDVFAQGGVTLESNTDPYDSLVEYQTAVLSLATKQLHSEFLDRGPPGRAPPFFIV